ncbi:WXG100 family type VII secretion target [Saccharopolyspora griseoalba]|uniref:WXG100 family type VII secretion target n=1 Tax=Saccharopolyspora griseoalba TaxID=1431848 RepID=A0ABW2LMM2_9PSEU
MTSESDLLVTADESVAAAENNNTANPASGGGAAESFFTLQQSFENKDWDTFGLNALGAGVDVIGLAADPLGTLISWGFGWAIENISFLREPFDALMGNPDAISGMASTWSNIGQELQKTGDDYAKAARGTTGWEGQAADSYRTLSNDITEKIAALSAAGKSMESAVQGAGAVVSAVRGIVRDIITGAISEIISCLLKWGIATVCTAGVAAGGAIADVIRIALKWADKISEWMKKLGNVLHSLWSKLDELGSAATAMRQGIDRFFRNLGETPGLNPNQEKVTWSNVSKAADAKIAAAPDSVAPPNPFKPAFKGDLAEPGYSPVTAGWDDKGVSKFGFEAAKETAKLDDGSEQKPNGNA